MGRLLTDFSSEAIGAAVGLVPLTKPRASRSTKGSRLNVTARTQVWGAQSRVEDGQR